MRKKFERLVGMTAAAALLLGTITGVGVLATDSETDNLLPGESVVQSDDIVNIAAQGTDYTVSEPAGNAEEGQNEEDITSPVITLKGETEVYVVTGGSYTEPGYTAEDNVDGDLTASVVVGGDTVNTAVEGTYTITYNVSDAAGNAAEEKTRTVTVGPDITPPVITLKGNASMSVTVGDLYTEPGYTAEDNVDGDLTTSVVVGGDAVNISAAGTYTITYTVSDAAGNNASATRTVKVTELDYVTNFCIDTSIPTKEPNSFSNGGNCRQMFDGDADTFCRAWNYKGAGCTGEYVLKFKGTKPKKSFNRLVVITGGSGGAGGSFSLSLQIHDSEKDPWIDVLDVAIPNGSDKTTTVDFDAVSAKYVRFYIHDLPANADYFNIKEIQLWMDEGHYKTGKDLKALTVPSKTGIDFTLPTVGRCGTAIEWTSSNPALLDTSGHVVARPENAEGEKTVRLTATATFGQTTQTAEFDVVVTPKNIVEDASLSGIENAENLNDADYNTVVNLTDQCEVEAAFDSKKFLSKAEFALVGQNKPTSIEVLAWDGNDYVLLGDQTPTATGNVLTLTFPAGEYEKLKFRFNGSASAAEMLLGMTDDDAVDYLAERLTVSDESPDKITKDLILKSRGEQEQLVTWSSDNTAVVHDNGSVIRPAQDTNVRITAVITKGNSSKTVYFDITVLKTTSGGGSGAGGGKGTGGRGNSGSQIIAPVTTPVLSPTEVPEETIKPGAAIRDMDASHWAYEYVEQLKNAGIVSGDENGNFAPDRTITRAEYVKLLVTAFGLAGEADAFDDVAADAWYLPYVTAARANGIVLGDEKNCVRPDAEITRQDMAVLLGRTLEAKGLVPIPKREYSEFADRDAISEYAAVYIQAIYCGGIIDGTGDGTFEPQSLATRAQAAKVFAVALKED